MLDDCCLEALSDRLLDYDENVRKHVVAAICDLACHSVKVIPVDTVKTVAERLRDKSVCPFASSSFIFGHSTISISS